MNYYSIELFEDTMITRPLIGTFFKLFLGVVFISALLSGVGCDTLTGLSSSAESPEDAAEPISTVGYYTVKTEPVPLILRQSGRIAAYNTAQVRPQVNGIILKRTFEEGAFVKQGQLLYQIDPAVYEANFQKAMANQSNLERTKKRAEELKENRAVSVQDYEDSLYAWEISKADTELARLNLDYCQIKAPIDGKIGFSNITLGALATNGQAEPLTSIEQINPIYVDVNPPVSECLYFVQDWYLNHKSGEDATNETGETNETNETGESETELEGTTGNDSFFLGAKARIVLENGAKYPQEGTIKALCNRVQEDTGTIALRAEFPNPDGILLPGMFVRVQIEQGVRENGILIPQQALCRDTKGKPYVWIVLDAAKGGAGQGGFIVQKRAIQSERAIGNAWLIDEGLGAGDRVVVEGLQYVSQNGSVLPVEAGNVQVNTIID